MKKIETTKSSFWMIRSIKIGLYEFTVLLNGWMVFWVSSGHGSAEVYCPLDG